MGQRDGFLRNQQDRQTLIQTNQKKERQNPNQQNQKWKGGHNIRHWGNPENYQVIFQKSVFEKSGKCKGNGQFSFVF